MRIFETKRSNGVRAALLKVKEGIAMRILRVRWMSLLVVRNVRQA